MLSTLNSDQRLALAGFLSIVAKADKVPALKALLSEQSYGKLYRVLSISKPAPFSEPSFIDAAMMAPGLRNAHFFLISIEQSGKQDSIDSLTKALATHCWAQVADQINKNLTPDRQFSNSELQYAYAPGDSAACSMNSSGLATVLGPVIGAGLAVGGFFSGTLPEFFEGDFTNFFTSDVSDFFTQDVSGFFTNDVAGFFTGDVANFFTDDVAGAFTSAGDTISAGFESGFESVKDFFGGLF